MKKTSNPYGADYEVKVPPETIETANSQAKGKARARYPHKPLMPEQTSGEKGKMKTRAYTPGAKPAGS